MNPGTQSIQIKQSEQSLQSPNKTIREAIFKSLLTGKRLRISQWNPVNITEDVIKRYENFNTKGCPDILIFGDFNDQPIPSNYFNILNDDDDDVNNIIVTPIDYVIPENKGVEDAVVPNDEDIENEIIVDDYDSLALEIDPLQNKILLIEGVDNENEGGRIEGVYA